MTIMAKSLEQKLDSPFYKYMKRIGELISINFIFCVVSIGSLLVLFFPGLVSMHKIIYNYLHDIDQNVYKTFFKEIKEQWSFNWRIELLGMGFILVVGGLIYIDFVYIKRTEYNIIAWLSLAFLIAVALAGFTIFINLMLFNDYYKDDTFNMMLKKAALISRKKKKTSFLNLIIFGCFFVVMFICPYLLPFLSYPWYIYAIGAINRKQFTKISQEEVERACLPENLFLPVTKEDE